MTNFMKPEIQRFMLVKNIPLQMASIIRLYLLLDNLAFTCDQRLSIRIKTLKIIEFYLSHWGFATVQPVIGQNTSVFKY